MKPIATSIFSLSLAGLVLLAGVGCGGEERAAPTAAAPQAEAPAAAAQPPQADAAGVKAEAEQVFATRCVTCHGARGAGDGPASAGLTPKPRNFQDAEWQASVSNEHIEKIIMYGGAAVGRSPAMPANPDLSSKPAVVLALRMHIRGLAP